MADLRTFEIAELQIGDEAEHVATGVVLADGRLLLAEGDEPTAGGIVPGELFILDMEGNRRVVAVNDLPNPNQLQRGVYISGVYCTDRQLTVDVLFYVDEFEAVTRSYRIPPDDPTAATLRWETTGAPQPSRYSPDGSYVIFTEWGIDPVYGPTLTLRNGETGALAELFDLPSFEPEFDNGDVTRFPVALTWLEDGRLLYEYETYGTFQGRPGRFQLAIDVSSGATESVTVPFIHGCTFGNATVVGTDDGSRIERLDGTPIIDYPAVGRISFTC